MPLRPPADVLTRTPVYRMVHIDCLDTLLRRDALHAPSCSPNDGLPYRGIHAAQTQVDRGETPVPCGPRGAIRDYVGFYFGPRSPMLLRLHTGRGVARTPQSDIIYLVTHAQTLVGAGLQCVFTDRHSLARFAAFRERLEDLAIMDMPAAYAEQWNTTAEYPDRQEKKQAEFLVHRVVPWSLIAGIGVLDKNVAVRVERILDEHPQRRRPSVAPRRGWYY